MTDTIDPPAPGMVAAPKSDDRNAKKRKKAGTRRAAWDANFRESRKDVRHDPNQQWFDTLEAARYLRYSRKTFEQMRHDGEGPDGYFINSRWRYEKADLDAWMRSQPRTRPEDGEAGQVLAGS